MITIRKKSKLSLTEGEPSNVSEHTAKSVGVRAGDPVEAGGTWFPSWGSQFRSSTKTS